MAGSSGRFLLVLIVGVPPVRAGAQQTREQEIPASLEAALKRAATTGAGLGASHQTGWTALVASLIDEWRR
jgi:hypothetical protein